MSIQPVNKAAEHLINSTPVLGEGKKKREKKKRNSDCLSLIKNGKGGGGRGGALSQAVGRIGRSIMLQSNLCNYFKASTKFTLD